jgi:hypothetical protein
VACYKKEQRPSEYYACVRQVDEAMEKNSDFLRGKFGELEVGSFQAARSRQTQEQLQNRNTQLSREDPRLRKERQPLVQEQC